MIKVAAVEPDGQVGVIFIPFEGVDIPDGSFDSSGRLLKLIPVETDDEAFIETQLWDFNTSDWINRGARPNVYYDWDGTQWIKSPRFLEYAERERLRRLFASDWTQGDDAGLSAIDKLKWQQYRKILRDMDLDQYDSPESIEWPKEI